MRTAVRLILVLTSGAPWVLGAEPAQAQAQAVEEYRLKAAFVSSFAGFVEWPQDVLKSSGASIVICVLGENPFGPALDQAVIGKSVQDRKLSARGISGVQQATGCQILFISSSERKHFRSILKDPQLSGVLTVGDTGNFTAEGGIIGLEVEDDRIRILINLGAAEQGRVRISSRLLSLARIVKK
jgi:YfiR/HmsC-like